MAAENSQTAQSPVGHNLIRVVIASYFIAVSIGLITGTNGIALAALVLPAQTAELVGSSALFILGTLVLTGIWLRPAAILLSVIILAASLLQYFGPASALVLSELWRDLTLVCALMLTYSASRQRGAAPATLAQWTPKHRNAGDGANIRPRRVVVSQASNITRLPTVNKPPSVFRKVDNIFVDYRDDVLAS